MTALAVVGLTLLAAYLIGAIPFGYLVARWRGVNIFEQGSGNIGATNVGRVLGRRFGILVFLLDLAKGALPVAAAGWVAALAAAADPEFSGAEQLPIGAGLAALLGHMASIYLRFRGGKGVATGAGVVAVLLPGPALGALLTWVAVVAASRYVSLASLAAAFVLCIDRLALTDEPFGPENRLLTLFCLVAAGLVFVRHRANIGRLLHGTENRSPETSTMLLFTKIVHVLALGLWFGMAVFFTFVVGLALFKTFWAEADKDGTHRPIWFPLPPEFARDPAAWTQGDSAASERPLFTSKEEVRREQGSRAGGTAVSPLFDWYFLLQGICGLLAVATALRWSWDLPGESVHRVRFIVLLLALATVVIGWPLERKVSELRTVRNASVDAVLRGDPPTPESIHTAAANAQEFARWHVYSLFLNFGTVVLVTIGMALAASLPAEARGTTPGSALKSQLSVDELADQASHSHGQSLLPPTQ